MKLYRPSNGTEGDMFMDNFCYQCIHENPKENGSPKCEIITLVMCYDTKDKEYPKEWCYDENEKPTCTKFTKFDWSNDNDGDEYTPPLAPIPDDPNQLCMPFIIDEVNSNIEQPALALAAFDKQFPK